MTLTYVSEGNAGPAVLADAQAWATTYNHQGIVAFSSTLMDVWYPFGVDMGGGSFGIALPGIIFIGPNMKIAKMSEPTIQEIELVVPGL